MHRGTNAFTGRVLNAEWRMSSTEWPDTRLPLLHSPFCILHFMASGRTRTDEYKFTKLVLWLLRHRGKVASTAGIAPATSTFARWRSDLTELRGRFKCGTKNAKCRIAQRHLRVWQVFHSAFSIPRVAFEASVAG